MPKAASHSRIALSSIASNTGARLPGEEFMTPSTSAVAVCCSSASLSAAMLSFSCFLSRLFSSRISSALLSFKREVLRLTCPAMLPAKSQSVSSAAWAKSPIRLLLRVEEELSILWISRARNRRTWSAVQCTRRCRQRRSRVEQDLDRLRAPDAVSYNGGGPRWNKGETCPESERLTILHRSERVWRNCALSAIGPSRARRLIAVPD